MALVKITNGLYRGQELSGTFEVFQNFRRYSPSEFKNGFAKDGLDGSMRVIDGDTGKPFYMHVKETNIELIESGAIAVVNPTPETKEVDLEELDLFIRKRFNVLDMLADGVIDHSLYALIVSGAPGVGKTYKFEKELTKAHEEGRIRNFEHIKGKVTPLFLYETLYKNSSKDDIVLLDDSDNIFQDEVSLNIMKAALDSGDVRKVSYGSTCKYLEENDIPPVFDFQGTVVFITNLDFQGMVERGTRLSPHFSALLSRSHYLSLGVYTPTEIMVRIQQVAQETPLLASRGVDDKATKEMIDWMWENVQELREVSIRTLLKLADYAKMTDWKEMAEVMLLK